MGSAVSLSSDGTILAAGAYGHPGGGSTRGTVRVYQWNGTDTWIQLGSDINGEANGDVSGDTVNLNSDGTIVAIGTMINTTDSGPSWHLYTGQVRIYQWNGTDTWTQVGSDIDGQASREQAGIAGLSRDGTTVAIGGPAYTQHTPTFKGQLGRVGVYQIAEIQKTGYNAAELKDHFTATELKAVGFTAVQLKGVFTLAELRTGGFTIAELAVVDPSPQFVVDIDGEAAGDQSGYSVSINQDGTIVAIGAPYNDGSKGHVRVYPVSYTHLTLPTIVGV